MTLRRRDFLHTAALGAAAASGLPGGHAAPSEPGDASPPRSSDPTAWVPLGDKLTAPRIMMGTGMRAWMRESNLTRRGDDYTRDLLRYAYDEGVRGYDMADLYGIHHYVADAMADKSRDSYFLITKIWFHPRGLQEEARPDADVVVQRFLKECKTDYLDLVQIHCMSKQDWTDTYKRQMDLLETLKEKGDIRAHGVSCHALSALETAARDPWVDVVHTRINPYGIKMDGPTDEVLAVIEKIHAAGKGVIGMKVIGEGQLSHDDDKKKASVDMVAKLGCVDAMVAGFETKADVDQFKRLTAQALSGAEALA